MIEPLLKPAPIQEVDEALLQEITTRIVEHCRPRRIVLFGSRAWGTQRRDSDVDLFVEMESNESPHERRMRIRRLFQGRRWGLDLLVYTPDEIVAERAIPGTMVPVIEREGRVLYEREDSSD